MLSTSQIEQFNRDGYLKIEQAITADTLARLRGAADAWVEKSRAMTESTDQVELEPTHSADNPRLRRLNHPVALSDIFWQVASGDAILDRIEGLLGPDIKFHHSKLNMKASKGGEAIGWHQDFAFFPHTNEDVLACGIALDDSTIDNGCLMVIPGTHRIGLLNHRDKNGEFVGKIVGDEDKYDESQAVSIELKAGDMSIHHACAIHGSTQNNSGNARRLLIYEYAATDAIQLDWRMPKNEYSNRIVRGGPLTHARLSGAKTIELRGDTTTATSIFDRQSKAEVYNG